MQLFALNEANTLVSARDAARQQDYICPECRSRVRLRSGPSRAPHFYHLDEERECRQQGKSLSHLHTQFRLQKMIPEVKLEVPFPTISRIADVAWEDERVVFEVQCSPITAAELIARNRDYLSLGWTPIWIFHEDRYNKRKLSAAEWVVRHQIHYYTDINEEGTGELYSHFSEFAHGRRQKPVGRTIVNLSTPERVFNKIHFAGDGWEERLSPTTHKMQFKKLILQTAVRVYTSLKAIFYHYLEKSCNKG